MQKGFYMTQEDFSILAKAVLRLHKEHGTYELFKKQGVILEYRKEYKEHNLSNLLITWCWKPLREFLIKNKNKDEELLIEEAIMASIYQLEIIDYLIGKKSLSSTCNALANSEFNYISGRLSELYAMYKPLSPKTIEEIDKSLEKYCVLIDYCLWKTIKEKLSYIARVT